MKSICYVLLSLIILSGCDKLDTKSASDEDVEKKLDEVVGQAKSLFNELRSKTGGTKGISDLAQDEVSKLMSVEYRVIEIDDVGDTKHFDYILNNAGQDRWDCFDVEKIAERHKYRFFCKRKPKSYLRYFKDF